MTRPSLRLFQVGIFSAIFLTISGCNPEPVETPITPSQVDNSGSITDWPASIQQEIEASPDITLAPFGADEIQTLRRLAAGVERILPTVERDATRGTVFTDSANQVVARAMPDWELPQMYKLGSTPVCEIAGMSVTLSSAMTKISEAKAKQHAFAYGNQFSWPGFVQAVWADVSADRARLEVENGTSVQDADEAVNELGSMIWHGEQTVSFETKSFAETNDPASTHSAEVMKTAIVWAKLSIDLISACKPTL